MLWDPAISGHPRTFCGHEILLDSTNVSTRFMLPIMCGKLTRRLSTPDCCQSHSLCMCSVRFWIFAALLDGISLQVNTFMTAECAVYDFCSLSCWHFVASKSSWNEQCLTMLLAQKMDYLHFGSWKLFGFDSHHLHDLLASMTECHARSEDQGRQQESEGGSRAAEPCTILMICSVILRNVCSVLRKSRVHKRRRSMWDLSSLVQVCSRCLWAWLMYWLGKESSVSEHHIWCIIIIVWW